MKRQCRPNKQMKNVVPSRSHQLSSMEPARFTCDICNITLPTKRRLTTHFLNHNENKTYACSEPDCGRIFKLRGSFYKHRLSHDDKPHMCSYHNCNKKFAQRTDLKRHIHTHTHGWEAICMYWISVRAYILSEVEYDETFFE